jgi:hypothetical protein
MTTVSFVAGGTLLASGVSLLVFAPRAVGDRRAAKGLQLAGEW